jgi:hypothetical protein
MSEADHDRARRGLVYARWAGRLYKRSAQRTPRSLRIRLTDEASDLYQNCGGEASCYPGVASETGENRYGEHGR